MNDIAIWKVKEWRYDLDPPKDIPGLSQPHYRLFTRPTLRVSIKKCSDGDCVIEFMMEGQMNCQPRYADMTPQEARKLAHALCDMADKFDQETRAA